MTTRSSEEWLTALSGGDEQEYERALHDLRDYLLRAALVYLTQQREELTSWNTADIRDLAENFAQEALLDIQDNLDGFRGDSKFTTWCYRFVINRAASELRRRRYHDLSLDRLREEEPAAYQRMFGTTAAASPELRAERRMLLRLLREIVAEKLSEKQRLAVVGVYLRGYPMDAVAAALGLSRNALYKLLHDARKRIKQELHARHYTQGDILAAFNEE